MKTKEASFSAAFWYLSNTRTEEVTCVLLAVSILLVQEYPHECQNQRSNLIWPLHTELNLRRGILDVRRGGDLKFSGLRLGCHLLP